MNMKWLNNMKIGTKLTVAFSTVIVGLIFIGLFGGISVNSLVTADKQMYNQDLQAVAELGTLSRDYYQLRVTALKTVYDDFTADGAAALDSTLKEAQTGFDEALQKYQNTIAKNDDADQKNLDTLKQGMSDYATIIGSIIETIKSGDKNAVTQKMTDAAAKSQIVADTLDAMQKMNVEQSAGRETSNNSLGNTTIIVIIVVGLILLVIAMLLATNVTRNITSSIGKIVASANKMAEGDMNFNLDVTSKDEIGVLAQSFQKVGGAINGLISDIEFLVESAKDGKLNARADATKHSGEYKTIIEGFNSTLEAIITPMNEAIMILKKVSLNDYSAKVEGNYRGDMKVMTDSINDILGRLLSIQRVFEELAVGDISQLPVFEKVGKRCENDKLMPSAVMMMQAIQDLTDDANMLSTEAAKGNLAVRGDASKYEGKYNQLISGINGIIDAIAIPINETVAVLGTMAQNDLTHAINGQYQGEFQTLAQSINTVIETLGETLGDINNAAEQVASGTHQVSDGSQALSQGATEQASSIEELTASLSEIAAQTRQNAINAGQASDLAKTARDNAVEGNTQMNDLQKAMTEINEASASISKIIKVIDEIAFQTNLLALNAAVEAARAGQHGKGFAVVAEEVRNLAQRSANAAKETTEMISGSIKKVAAGTQIANETAAALVKIVSGVEKATDLVGGIARASNDQAMAVAQINTGIEQVSQVVQTNSATAEESAAASEELSSQATLLKEMVSRFTLSSQNRISGQKAAFQPQASARSLGSGKVSVNKPKISLNDRDFGKY
jgi:methyl-accepting chemotaxis protein